MNRESRRCIRGRTVNTRGKRYLLRCTILAFFFYFTVFSIFIIFDVYIIAPKIVLFRFTQKIVYKYIIRYDTLSSVMMAIWIQLIGKIIMHIYIHTHILFSKLVYNYSDNYCTNDI